MQGLENIGATCAANSLIQIICRTKFLRDSILLEKNIPDNTLAIELKEIIQLMYIDKKSLSPRKFITKLYNIFSDIFTFGEQLDINELWLFLFNKISSEIGNELNDNMLIDDNINSNELTSSISDTNIELLYNKCTNVMNNINNNKTSNWLESSQGIILNIITCNKCKNTLYNFEPFSSIPLDINNNINKSVTNMFRNSLKSYINKDEWKCNKCNECTEYTKIFKIWKLPPILIFNIKRFDNINVKNHAEIDINEKIIIKKGNVLSNIDANYNYNLTSIGLHLGDINNGHYCAICKDETDDKFILYNDLNINKIEDNNYKKIIKNNKDAYMIIYTLT